MVGVPWQGSASACLAWGDLFVSSMFKQVLKRLSSLRRHGTPMMAHPELPDLQHLQHLQMPDSTPTTYLHL